MSSLETQHNQIRSIHVIRGLNISLKTKTMNSTDTSNVAEQLETPVDITSLQPMPEEPAQAHEAFVAFFRLGQDRSLQAVAEKCGSSIDTVKKWSSTFGWKDRINSFNTGILQ